MVLMDAPKALLVASSAEDARMLNRSWSGVIVTSTLQHWVGAGC